ncbi:hypothetical protein Cri9333_0330 [Crinalium epipsammum PCC 9333]|uniref:Uncharacterized protein n=1 Tax=Crinalium epipsammum PCC 9333 TaxID=1173022 RepID=K9VV01_9CYAN|nr:hypothetical protein [Crinalium epipsammum]AFZ11312.1 hypothetical protein Cri9333_0330 [Crinalium epipsammum PCC 9333]
MKEIKELLDAKQNTFSGKLPSILLRRKIQDKIPERAVVVQVVCSAISKVVKLEND